MVKTCPRQIVNMYMDSSYFLNRIEMLVKAKKKLCVKLIKILQIVLFLFKKGQILLWHHLEHNLFKNVSN